MADNYNAVLNRSNQIIKKSLGIDYDTYKMTEVSFDYERMMNDVGYSISEIAQIQNQNKVGNTPLFELKNITDKVRKISRPSKGARIFLKDEATNPSGSFKARRASVSIYEAKKKGYPGVVAATSGNYGAAVASQAAMNNLKCIIIQELFDSNYSCQPEIIEKTRKCEAFGAEVLMMSVGPELFYYLLLTLEETGFFNASLYTPYSVIGIETLGWEMVNQLKRSENQMPDAIVITHAGGGNITGTARGALRAGAKNTQFIAASVDLSGLHMASDIDFNKKSFTTGHTGFGIPFASWPDRTDVPKNAARPLRYMDRYVKVTQGEVFYATQLLAEFEGMERGPAGNISLAAAISLAKKMRRDQIIVVQETEYTGAGKHPTAQLNFAFQNGIKIRKGNPRDSIPGKVIIIPEKLEQIEAVDINLVSLKSSYIRNLLNKFPGVELSPGDIEFIGQDIKLGKEQTEKLISTVRENREE